jgi:hypothetical protein
MRYFLDTEFNGFGGSLISLALVPEDPDQPAFYAATACDNPTDWVRANVLPFLEIDPVAPNELGRRMAAYLHNDEDPLLVADWPEDIALAARALIAAPGRRYAVSHIRFELCDIYDFDSASSSAVPHNAYHDAMALRAHILLREHKNMGR